MRIEGKGGRGEGSDGAGRVWRLRLEGSPQDWPGRGVPQVRGSGGVRELGRKGREPVPEGCGVDLVENVCYDDSPDAAVELCGKVASEFECPGNDDVLHCAAECVRLVDVCRAVQLGAVGRRSEGVAGNRDAVERDSTHRGALTRAFWRDDPHAVLTARDTLTTDHLIARHVTDAKEVSIAARRVRLALVDQEPSFKRPLPKWLAVHVEEVINTVEVD